MAVVTLLPLIAMTEIYAPMISAMKANVFMTRSIALIWIYARLMYVLMENAVIPRLSAPMMATFARQMNVLTEFASILPSPAKTPTPAHSMCVLTGNAPTRNLSATTRIPALLMDATTVTAFSLQFRLTPAFRKQMSVATAAAISFAC